jgi:hypothetical protein
MVFVKTPYIMGYASHFSITLDPPRHVLCVIFSDGLRIGVKTFGTKKEVLEAYEQVYDAIINRCISLQFEECIFP